MADALRKVAAQPAPAPSRSPTVRYRFTHEVEFTVASGTGYASELTQVIHIEGDKFSPKWARGVDVVDEGGRYVFFTFPGGYVTRVPQNHISSIQDW